MMLSRSQCLNRVHLNFALSGSKVSQKPLFPFCLRHMAGLRAALFVMCVSASLALICCGQLSYHAILATMNAQCTPLRTDAA